MESIPKLIQTDATNNATAYDDTASVKSNQKTQIAKVNDKVSQEELPVGSEAREITFESILQGLKLKKDLHFGNLSEQSWKSNKPIITKVLIIK